MLLVHQAGSVRVGEVVRYTVTYTPSSDRILPSPSVLYLKIKNTSPIALRAAYLHGPYSLYVSAYPSTFNPHQKTEQPDKHGVPEFEPFLKAGAHWTCKLMVPEDIRETGANYAGSPSRSSMDSVSSVGQGKKSVTWIIEVVSQVIFSTGAVVHYEVMVSRDERSLDLGFAAVAAHGHGAPGQLDDHRKAAKKKDQKGTRGVYSRAIKLTAEDTEALWNKPELPPAFPDAPKHNTGDDKEKPRPRKKQKVHLVVLTHGLHSNLNADMLFMKESIDATVAQAREDARERRAKQKSESGIESKSEDAPSTSQDEPAATAPLSGGQENLADDEDEEQVIVRGFSGNAIKTERGIQYLGKRLAKFILKLTYPSQPFLPMKKKTVVRSLSDKFSSPDKSTTEEFPAAHHGSSVHRDDQHHNNDLAYEYTSISFVGHSLGGLVQLYAIAYIQKHAPEFFDIINPVNFICMASPLLGLSNENPLYVKFALDFGLVGRTGQDLGLTWRAPTLAKSGWSAMGSVFGQKDHKEDTPSTKPLLRVLPTGPAHRVLHKFRNRTVYSNVVNDGIVPLRTSCLLFLDWKGLDKVSKYRRDNGLIGTMAEWGWAEITGANAERDISVSPSPSRQNEWQDDGSQANDGDITVPQPSDTATTDDNKTSGVLASDVAKYLQPRTHHKASPSLTDSRPTTSGSTSSLLGDIFSFFRPTPSSPKSPSEHQRSPSAGSHPSQSPSFGFGGEHVKKPPKAVRPFERAQTLPQEEEDSDPNTHEGQSRPAISRGTTDNPTMRPDKSRPKASRGDSVDHTSQGLSAPPKTSFFESASDLLHPPIPSTQWIVDPDSRPRTIFHDRVYHPSDIPPPPIRRQSRLIRTFSSDKTPTRTDSDRPTLRSTDSNTSLSSEAGGMKVEEKIARAYHQDLTWRKVLVKLEPDAHNNMIVRRMFANAYGWPVVKHLCDTHFSDAWTARTGDEQECNVDRARTASESDLLSKDDPDRGRKDGEEVEGQTSPNPQRKRGPSESRDQPGSLDQSTAEIQALESRHRQDVENWDDHFFSGSESDSDNDDDTNKRDERPKSRRVLHTSTTPTKNAPGPHTPSIILDPAADKGHFTSEPAALDGSAAMPVGQVQSAVDEAMHTDVTSGLGISHR